MQNAGTERQRMKDRDERTKNKTEHGDGRRTHRERTDDEEEK